MTLSETSPAASQIPYRDTIGNQWQLVSFFEFAFKGNNHVDFCLCVIILKEFLIRLSVIFRVPAPFIVKSTQAIKIIVAVIIPTVDDKKPFTQSNSPLSCSLTFSPVNYVMIIGLLLIIHESYIR